MSEAKGITFDDLKRAATDIRERDRKAADALVAEKARGDEAVALLRKQRREHLYVEDCWYSCPKAEDGCCDERQGDECNCGADAANAELDAFLAREANR